MVFYTVLQQITYITDQILNVQKVSIIKFAEIIIVVSVMSISVKSEHVLKGL